MSAQPLNDRNVRRAGEATGLPIIAALAADNYTWLVVTNDHRHFKVNRHTWEVTQTNIHWTSCKERFPQDTRP